MVQGSVWREWAARLKLGLSGANNVLLGNTCCGAETASDESCLDV